VDGVGAFLLDQKRFPWSAAHARRGRADRSRAAVDDRLPIGRESLWKRFCAHVPLSLAFIALFAFLNYDARLAALRSQLHPHFLFNSLNAISAYIDGSPRTARLMLERVGDLLRLSLEHYEAQEIPLHQELTFLEKYLELQRMRFEDRLDVRIQMDPDTAGALVPTFILQPLVENAVRHGVASHHKKGIIEVKAVRSDGHLDLSIRDDGPGLPYGWTMASCTGVGLSNTLQRLDALER
jgi:two-component system, LytTR family, sensor kinase